MTPSLIMHRGCNFLKVCVCVGLDSIAVIQIYVDLWDRLVGFLKGRGITGTWKVTQALWSTRQAFCISTLPYSLLRDVRSTPLRWFISISLFQCLIARTWSVWISELIQNINRLRYPNIGEFLRAWLMVWAIFLQAKAIFSLLQSSSLSKVCVLCQVKSL